MLRVVQRARFGSGRKRQLGARQPILRRFSRCGESPDRRPSRTPLPATGSHDLICFACDGRSRPSACSVELWGVVMLVQHIVVRAGSMKRTGPGLCAVAKVSVLLALVLAVGACTAAPRLHAFADDPADPSARVPAAGYRSTLGSYTSLRPVDPLPWREQNERVTPRPSR
jgi:hypothetical protein